MDKLISVILPVYNAGKYLPQSIESILNQTYKYIEFIIINDGSKDDSIVTIKKYAQLDRRIRYLDRENKGLIFTLNEAIQFSKGSYIARMDQDDISLPDRLELQYKYMLENNLDICGGDYIEIDKNGKFIASRQVPKNNKEILITLASNVPFAHPSVMIKKSFLLENNLCYGMNGHKYAEDLDLWMNMYNKGAKFGNINQEILKYRILDTSLSRSSKKQIKKEVNLQFQDFVEMNKKKYESVIKLFLNDLITNQMRIIYCKAFYRYFFLSYDYKLLFKVIKRIHFKYCLRALISHLRIAI